MAKKKLNDDVANPANSDSIVQYDAAKIAQKRKEAREAAEQLFAKQMEKEVGPYQRQMYDLEKEHEKLMALVATNESTRKNVQRIINDILGIEEKPVKAKGTKASGTRGAGSKMPASELPGVAKAIATFIKQKGAEGTTRREIVEHIASVVMKPNGEGYTLLPTIVIPEFLKEHKADVKLVSTGAKKSLRYYHETAS